MAASMFMNSNSLPIALMQSLVVTVPHLKWDEDDTESGMVGRALSYLVLYSTLGMVLRWSYGVHLLAQADPESAAPTPAAANPPLQPYSDNPLLIQVDDVSPQTSTLAATESTASITFDEYTRRDPRNKLGDEEQTSALQVPQRPEARVFMSFPNTPISSALNLKQNSAVSGVSSDLNDSRIGSQRAECGSDSESEDEPLLLSRNNHVRRTARPAYKRLFKQTWRYIKRSAKAFNEFMTVPLWAALLSLIVALTPPLQHTLDNHLTWIKGALTAAGNCSIPMTLVVLGAYFYVPSAPVDQFEANSGPGPETGSRNSSHAGGRSASFAGSVRSMLRLSRLDRWEARNKSKGKEEARPGETRTVAIAVISRMILTPLLLFPLMAVGARYDFPQVFDEYVLLRIVRSILLTSYLSPVFIVSNILLISSPPALTLAQVCL